MKLLCQDKDSTNRTPWKVFDVQNVRENQYTWVFVSVSVSMSLSLCLCLCVLLWWSWCWLWLWWWRRERERRRGDSSKNLVANSLESFPQDCWNWTVLSDKANPTWAFLSWQNWRCQTGCRGGGTRRGHSTFVTAGSRAGGSPESCLKACGGTCSSAGVGRERSGPRRFRDWGVGAIFPMFRRGCQSAKGRAMKRRALRSPFTPIHKTWKSGFQETHRVWGPRVNDHLDVCNMVVWGSCHISVVRMDSRNNPGPSQTQEHASHELSDVLERYLVVRSETLVPISWMWEKEVHRSWNTFSWSRLTVLRKPKQFLLIQIDARMVSQLLILGIWV